MVFVISNTCKRSHIVVSHSKTPRMIPTEDASARKREIEEKLKQVGTQEEKV